jgi:hypothetical protein
MQEIQRFRRNSRRGKVIFQTSRYSVTKNDENLLGLRLCDPQGGTFFDETMFNRMVTDAFSGERFPNTDTAFGSKKDCRGENWFISVNSFLKIFYSQSFGVSPCPTLV